MLIFDKELKALPAAGDRNPGVTFSVTLQGTIFAGSPGSPPPPAPHPPPKVPGVLLAKPLLQDAPPLESWSEG